MAKSKKKKYILPLIIVVIIALAVMKSCGVFGSNEKLDQVDTQQATTATIVQIVTASGKIKPSTEVKIAPEVSGEITQLTVKEGDEVKKGQLLVQIKQDIYISAVNRAQAAVQQAIASLEQSAARLKESESEYKRSKLLFESGTIARADVMAQGLVEAIKIHKPQQPIVTCIRGTNEEEAFKVLREAGWLDVYNKGSSQKTFTFHRSAPLPISA